MAALLKMNAAKCPSCKVVLLRPVPGSTCQMLCPACGWYHTATAQPAKQPPRPHSLLPTVEVTDTSQDPVRFIGAFPGGTSTSGSSILASNVSHHQGLYRRQDSGRECQQTDATVPLSPCSSSSGSSSPTQPSSWLPLPRVAAFPLGMGNIRRHSYQLIESQSASTPSRY